MATIIIPTPLRKFTANETKVSVRGETVREAFQDLSAQYPDLKKQLFDEAGNIRSFLRIYKGSTDIRTLNQSETALEPEAVVSIVPAIAGGMG